MNTEDYFEEYPYLPRNKIVKYSSKEEAVGLPTQLLWLGRKPDEAMAMAHYPTQSEPYKFIAWGGRTSPKVLKHELAHIILEHTPDPKDDEQLFTQELAAVLYAAKRFGWDRHLKEDFKENIRFLSSYRKGIKARVLKGAIKQSGYEGKLPRVREDE